MDSLHYALLAIVVLLVLYCARTWGSIVEGKELLNLGNNVTDGHCTLANEGGECVGANPRHL